jgi:predicted transcriptional regulator
MRTTQTMTVSLPPTLVRQFEEVRKRESRTRSELVREALRAYFESRYPAVRATKAEIAALRRGRAAFRRGNFVSLNQFLHDVDSSTHRSRTKRLPKAAGKRSGAR